MQTVIPNRFKASILIAEDNMTNQIVARGMLEYLGCRVDLVDNGKLALQAAINNYYDLIFMDCQMPDMDGYEATSQIRQWEKEKIDTRRVPIIALTAYAMQGDRERCLQAGMDDYLAKPFNEDDLADIMEKWLGKAGAKRQQVPRGENHEVMSRKGLDTDIIDMHVIENLQQLQQTGKPDIITRLVATYLKTSPDLIAALRQSLVQKDGEGFWKAAHSLKSSSANLGAQALAALCHQVEIQGKASDFRHCEDQVKRIEEEFVQVRQQLLLLQEE